MVIIVCTTVCVSIVYDLHIFVVFCFCLYMYLSLSPSLSPHSTRRLQCFSLVSMRYTYQALCISATTKTTNDYALSEFRHSGGKQYTTFNNKIIIYTTRTTAIVVGFRMLAKMNVLASQNSKLLLR